MIHCGDSPHPAHQGFADEVDADFYSLNNFPIDAVSDAIPAEMFRGCLAREYDICIAEGTRSLYGALAGQIANNSSLIYLAADHSLYELQQYDGGSRLTNQLISKYGMNVMETLFNRYIDGVIAVSEFIAEYTRNIINSPIRIAHPYIQPEIYTRLGELTPDLEKNTAVTVGTFSWYKGQDILSEVWELVRDKHPDAELNLVGAEYPKEMGNIPGVNVCGYVNNLPKTLSEAALYVHPARADAFPVSVLEALRVGLPTVSTSTTGNRSVIRNIDPKMVVERTPESLATAIINYFDHSLDKRCQLSQAALTQGLGFNKESRTTAFRNQFNNLLSEISQ
jgi:glycosyltransferase involved in cell wall biosynthesis